MRYYELIEAVLPHNILFHFTGMATMFRIVLEDKLAAQIAFGHFTNGKPNEQAPRTVSLTRNSTPRSNLPYGRARACLILDATKVKTVPTWGDSKSNKEMEERHQGDIAPLHDKLRGICLSLDGMPFNMTTPEGLAEFKLERPVQFRIWQQVQRICKANKVPIFFAKGFASSWLPRVKPLLVN